MCFIHTADWHLGNSMYRIDRASETDAFLKWLKERIVAEKADALKKTAEEKRHKKIKWDDLKKRVDDSEQKRAHRERKEKAKTQTSKKKNDIVTM